MHVVLLDNHDSFVYNLVDQFAVLGAKVSVFRNTTPAQDVFNVLNEYSNPDTGEQAILCISPGPGHPRESGSLMELTNLALAHHIPLLGICLGFQGLIEACGGVIDRVGPAHGVADRIVLTPEGLADPIFANLGQSTLDVARYHSLGTRSLPQDLIGLALSNSGIVMAAKHQYAPAIGLQFHPESILTTQGQALLANVLAYLSAPQPSEAQQPTDSTDQLVRNVIQGHRLNQTEARLVFEAVGNGALEPLEIASLLAAMRARGEHPEEIAGAAQAFRAAAVSFPQTDLPLIDIVGTGGDGMHTINISTAAAIVGASMGLHVAKHGNRSVSSKTGSADVIGALGLPLEEEPENAMRIIETNRFCFLFAQRYHPAMRFVADIRKTLATPTLFNLLGPLVNPAPLKYQVMGVADARRLEMIAQTLVHLGRDHALVVHGSGLDEITLHGPTTVYEVKDGLITPFTMTPQSLGLNQWRIEDIVGGHPEENAAALRAVFAGTGKPAHQETIAANAGAMLYTAGLAPSIAHGAQAALAHIQEGKPAVFMQTLQQEIG